MKNINLMSRYKSNQKLFYALVAFVEPKEKNIWYKWTGY